MKFAIWSVLFVAAALPAMGANFSGKWALQSQAGRGGRGGGTVLTLNQAGSEVTGTITVRVDAGTSMPTYGDIFGGKVEGDTLTFYIWTASDQPAKMTYTGTLSAAGDEITFTIAGGRGSGGGNTQQITAKRTK